jgi:hypothetical protein
MISIFFARLTVDGPLGENEMKPEVLEAIRSAIRIRKRAYEAISKAHASGNRYNTKVGSTCYKLREEIFSLDAALIELLCSLEAHGEL